MKPTSVAAAALAALAAAPLLLAQAPGRPVRVQIQEEKLQVSEPTAPVDPQQHIHYQFGFGLNFGFTVDGNRITYGQNGSTNNTLVRIDGRDVMLGGPPGRLESHQVALPPGPFGRKRIGHRSTWVIDNVSFTQVLEVVPSKLPPKAAPGQKRRLDTCLVRYEVENKDGRPHTVGLRTVLDMLIVNNDGALFASPSTHPGKVLDGLELRDKAVPEYLQVLQMPNLQNPGFVAQFTFKLGSRLTGPDRIVMTGLRASGPWEVAAVPAGGDSAIAVYFSPRQLKAKGKAEWAYAYGQGIASNPENEGKVSLALGGSFVPGKLFTVTAYVDEPVESQTLNLELPDGMALVEGRALQPVPLPGASDARAVVLWKGRVLKTGRFPLRVQSSNGVTYTRTITVSPPEAGDRPPAPAAGGADRR
jgi:hypothetical protein